MIPENLLEISFRQIGIFLTAAKYENFTRAAEELHMTQASVSRNIQALEFEIGIILFVRHKHRVRLTNAGKSLVKDFSTIVRQTEKGLENAGLQQQNQFNRFSVGDYSTTSADDYLLPITERFEKENPGVELDIERLDPISLLENLKEGKYDAAFFSLAGIPMLQEAGFDYVTVLTLPPCVVMSNRHPLFGRTDVTQAELLGWPVVAMRGAYLDYWTYVSDVCAEIGIETRDVKFVDNPYSLALELKRGNYISIMDRCFVPIDKAQLRYIELSGCKTQSGFVLAYAPDRPNPYLKKMVKACSRFFAESGCAATSTAHR